MKRIISALLAVLLIVSLCCVFTACDDLSSFLNDIIDIIGEDEPADPGDSGDIIIVEPDDPTEPTEPDDPVIVDPVEPDEPTEPTEGDEPVIVDPVEPTEPTGPEQPTEPDEPAITVDENGEYDDKDHVALYIHLYGKLPKNYMTKKDAESKGWTGGSLDQKIKGKAIGGSYFGNYEGLLPKKKGRSYYECDIDTIGSKSRGAKRIIYSNDGLVYYTDDHYETFTLLYGEE